MPKTYASRREPEQKIPSADSLQAPAGAVSNQALASLMLGGAGEQSMGSTLDELMQARMQRFAQNQIPQAEREADTIAASVKGARTPEEVKNQLGARMGADFGSVRFHTDADAVGRAESIGARAYTTGKDVYFGAGGFDPGVAAHELVHTAQQGAVESGMSTVAAPAGGVQMLQENIQRAGLGTRFLRAIARPFRRAGTGIAEFIGGKIGAKMYSGIESYGADKKDEAARLAAGGDYSQSANMRKRDVNAMVAQRKEEFLNGTRALPEATDTTAALDPFNRKAMSKIANDSNAPEGERARMRNLGENMDQEMMERTMRKATDDQRRAVFEHYRDREDQKRLAKEYQQSESGKMYLGTEGKDSGVTPEEYRDHILRMAESGEQRSDEDAEELAAKALNRSQNSGDVLLRTMLLMQMGNFQRKDTRKRKWWQRNITESKEWDQTMANAFSHGGRTSFLFGKGNEDTEEGLDAVTEQLFGGNMGHAAGVGKRAAATHHLSTFGGKAKEGHGVWAAIKSMFSSSYKHYGMDMAIGGAGTAGVNGQMINADGRSGHMYIGRQGSGRWRKGGLLMGLESDSPYRMNQTGHMHNAAAVAEDGSSTGGLKADLQGKKYGGRSVDLSGLKNSEVAGVLEKFTAYAGGLRRSNEEQYNALIHQISGKRMNAEALQNLLGSFMTDSDGGQLNGDQLQDLIRRARGGRR